MIPQRVVNGSVRYRLTFFVRQQLNSASSSSVTSDKQQATAETDPEPAQEQDDPRISELRDISRMRPWHLSILHGEPPPIDTFKWQKERWALKERYATYGRASGVDPGVFWPTQDELEEIRQEDEELHPKLSVTIEQMQQSKAEREKETTARYAEVEKNAKEYPKLLEAYRNRLREQQRGIDEEKRVKDDKIKEIQSYFGFAIDVTDPRFAAMMAKKEMDERQVRKKEQKKQKELEALRQIEEETKLLKQREQQQMQTAKAADSEPKAKAM